jgi:hypothetical protein
MRWGHRLSTIVAGPFQLLYPTVTQAEAQPQPSRESAPHPTPVPRARPTS